MLPWKNAAKFWKDQCRKAMKRAEVYHRKWIATMAELDKATALVKKLQSHAQDCKHCVDAIETFLPGDCACPDYQGERPADRWYMHELTCAERNGF